MSDSKSNFTMVPDAVIWKYGLTKAVIFSKVARYIEYGESDLCWASHARLARELKVNPSTIKRNLKDLVSDGLLRVMGRDRSGTNIYELVPERLEEIRKEYEEEVKKRYILSKSRIEPIDRAVEAMM